MSQHFPGRAAVFSAGSWGTAVAKDMADAGAEVVVHARRAGIAEAINTVHRNPGYFPDIDLPTSLTATTDPVAALEGADFLVLSIPAQSLRENLAVWVPHSGTGSRWDVRELLRRPGVLRRLPGAARPAQPGTHRLPGRVREACRTS